VLYDRIILFHLLSPFSLPLCTTFSPRLVSSASFQIANDISVSLRLGSTAPNFKADTTKGPIDFHEFIGDNWVVLFSHPEDYTPVCTTELGAFAKLEPEFAKRNTKLIGLSANTIESHGGWIKDIDEISGSNLNFPIIGDKERQVAYLYDM
jgi:alkyl hydroperoxide reductase subunit AhpC